MAVGVEELVHGLARPHTRVGAHADVDLDVAMHRRALGARTVAGALERRLYTYLEQGYARLADVLHTRQCARERCHEPRQAPVGSDGFRRE